MKKILLALLLAAVVILTAGVLIIVNRSPKGMSEAEKEKALTSILGRKVDLKGKQVAKGDVEHKGKYLFFLYPASASVYHQLVNGKEALDLGALEYFSFDMTDPRVIVNTEVVQAPSSVNRLIDYPGVRIRQTQADVYTQTQVEADSTEGFAYDKKDSTGFEKTALFYTNGKIYIFSFQSVDQKVLVQVFNKVINTAKFL